ncbi:hypothetical protein IFM89_029010 [Coptis chinensis]|uniref:glucose-6-phosphate 1-epimerase n=1 Tax=Coptis chinensis TaxID=261450 RepID=A0A835IFW7_9MAGN|nr:hypothetical protein IFM89_029010 [Coptis chinensis]
MSSDRVPMEITKGVNGLDKVVLREVRGSSAEVYLYGAHVTSWKNDHGEELLFVSSKVAGENGFRLVAGMAYYTDLTVLSFNTLKCQSKVSPVNKGGFLEVLIVYISAISHLAFIVYTSSCLQKGCFMFLEDTYFIVTLFIVHLYVDGQSVSCIWHGLPGCSPVKARSDNPVEANFKPPKAIRGGIPICFPQFSNLGSLEQHGFARNRFWSIDTDPPPFSTTSSNKAFVDLILKPSEEDMKSWPHSYEFRLRVTLGPGGDLMLTSRIRNTNTDGKPFTFTFAYHTYFSVSDISLPSDLVPLEKLVFSEVRVEGLETIDYLDNLLNRERFTEQGDAITFESEVNILFPGVLCYVPCVSFIYQYVSNSLCSYMKKVDKIYVSTPTKIAILDHEKKRTFVLRKDGLPDAVVWNPWDKKAKAMVDFGDDEYKHMLCVEAAAVEKPITLKPGEEWKGRQELSAVPSSYCSGQLDPQRVLQGS